MDVLEDYAPAEQAPAAGPWEDYRKPKQESSAGPWNDFKPIAVHPSNAEPQFYDERTKPELYPDDPAYQGREIEEKNAAYNAALPPRPSGQVIPGMERLGGVPPGPPKPPTVQVQDMNAGLADPTKPFPGQHDAPLGALPWEPVLEKVTAGPKTITKALQAVPQHKTGARLKDPLASEKELVTGATQTLGGVMELAKPLVAIGGAMAPARTVLTLATATAADRAAAKALKVAGASDEWAEFGGALAGVLTGVKGAHEFYEKVWKAAGSPTVEFGKIETPKEFLDMSDAELLAHANKVAAEKPKNADWQMQEIGKEVLRRQAGRGMGPASSEDIPIVDRSGEKAPPFGFEEPGPWEDFKPAEAQAEVPPSGVVPTVQAEPLTPEVPSAVVRAPAEPPAIPPVSAGIPAVPSAEPSHTPQVQPSISPAAQAQVAEPAPPEAKEVVQPKTEAVPEGAGVQSTHEKSSQVQPPPDRSPGWVGNIPTSEINVDAPRFQFKANVGQGGAGEELRGIEKWDPEKAGILAVWRDPANGKTYVVNGHHRVELAQRTGAPEMAVRYLDAKDAREARLKGALINIAEGRGESTDAARVFRDSDLTPADLQAQGVSLKGKVASEGMALSQLAQPIFDDVISGELSPARGAVIGNGVPNHADQRALYDLVKQGEKGGKRLTNDQLSELIQLAQGAPDKTEVHEDLFGEETVTRSLLKEKAEVSDYIRKQLSADRRLFGTVATQGAAERLKETGNVIKAGENAQVAESANQGLSVYDRLKSGAGPINAVLNRAAQSLADGESANEVKQRAYRQIKSEVAEQVRRLTGTPAGNGEGTEVVGREGPREAGRGERGEEEVAETSTVKPRLFESSATPLPGDQSLFSPEEEAAATPSAGEKDRLLGQQLTAQMKSGLPAKPAKLKPSKTRSMFEDEGPEQDTLFSLTYRGAPETIGERLSRVEATYKPGTKGQHGTVYTNGAGMWLLQQMLEIPREANGFMMPGSVARKLIRDLDVEMPELEAGRGANEDWDTAEAKASVKDMREALHEAQLRGGAVVVVGTNLRGGDVRGTLRHERMHIAQMGLRGHLKGHEAEFLAYPAAKKAAKEALSVGYSKDEVAFEIGAELAAGGYENLGLTRDEAKDLMFQYLRLLAKVHGPDALQSIQKLAPMMTEVLRGAREQAGSETVSGDREQSDRGVSGSTEGPQGIRSGIRQGVPGDEIALSRFGSRTSQPIKTVISRAVAQARAVARKINDLDALLTGRQAQPSEEPPQTYATLEDFLAAHQQAPSRAHGEGVEFKEPEASSKPKNEEITRTEAPPSSEPGSKERKTSKLAVGVQEKAIAEKLTEGFEGLPEYDVMNVEEQAKLAAQFLADEPATAVRVAMGHGYPPEGVRPESVFIAVENKAIADGDAELMRRLATESSLPSAATKMGQRIRMLGERVKNSPVALIQKVADAREKAVTKRYKDVEKIKVRIKLEVRDDIKRANKQKDAWISFVESIKCK